MESGRRLALVQRVEIITGKERRRRWSEGEKARLVAESCEPGAVGARDPDRVNHRNGYRDRLWETRAGTDELRITKLRKGSWSPPGFLGRFE
jgi:transposase-like protein